MSPSERELRWTGRLLAGCLLLAAAGPSLRAQSIPPKPTTQHLSFSADRETGAFALIDSRAHLTLFHGQMGVRADGQWIYAGNYPTHSVESSPFEDSLGNGQQILIDNHGLSDRPELIEKLKVYENHPYATVQVEVVNHNSQAVRVSDLRSLVVTGQPSISLGADDSYDRILADTFGEGGIQIYRLGHPPTYQKLIENMWPHAPRASLDRVLKALQGSQPPHLAVGNELIYNLSSRYGIFFGALTSKRFITTFHLRVGRAGAATEARMLGFEADATGTTAIQDSMALRGDPPDYRITLRLPIEPGGSLAAERILVAAGGSFLNMLENYGQAVRRLHHVEISTLAPMGFWSWGAYKNGLTSGAALTNAEWQAQHLERDGFDYFFMDDGWQYDRGEYTTANAFLFPRGIGYVGSHVAHLGLNFGLWTAPFEVSRRSNVYRRHPDWVVRNDHGQPIEVENLRGKDPVYALDTTNPGAQQYLWHTFHFLSQRWGVRFIKLDFMDTSAIEGDYYRPHTTAMEAQRIGLKIIRQAVGPDVLLDKDGSVALNPVGLVDVGRIASDVGRGFPVVQSAAGSIAAHFYEDRNFYISDPDSFSITRESVPASPPYWEIPALFRSLGPPSRNPNGPLTQNVARVAITLAAVAGGMYEIGDDLPELGREPDRLALVLNPDLLDMVKLGRPALPLDLMDYRSVDVQPSIFFLREDARQAILAVFNWTRQPLKHEISLRKLGLDSGFEAEDIFRHERDVPLHGDTLPLVVPAEDVRVIKFVDSKLSPAAPAVRLLGPAHLAVGDEGDFRGEAAHNGTPVVDWRWNFGDGITTRGRVVNHAYTQDGAFTVTLTAVGLGGAVAVERKQVEVQGTFDLRLHIDRSERWRPPVPPEAQKP